MLVGGTTTRCNYFFLPVVFLAAGFLVVALDFGDRFAFALVVALEADFAFVFAVEVFFFGDCLAVVFVVDFLVVDFAAAFFVAARFLGERVAVAFAAGFLAAAFFGAAFFFAAFLVAIFVAPDNRVSSSMIRHSLAPDKEQLRNAHEAAFHFTSIHQCKGESIGHNGLSYLSYRCRPPDLIHPSSRIEHTYPKFVKVNCCLACHRCHCW